MTMINIAENLLHLRRDKGITQDVLAEFLGVSKASVSKWENGDYMPPIDVLMLLSEIYGVSINEILNGRRLEDA